MNFYSLDGSKTHNDLFNDKPIYERFDNLTSQTDQNELFAGVPTTKSNATDSNYQCSDNYAVSGSTLGNIINNTTIDVCKSECVNSNSNCIGFNFNTSNNTCTLKQNATSLMNTAPSNTLCIKKSAGNKNCKVSKKKNTNENVFNGLNAIFENTPDQIKDKIESTIKNPSHKHLEEMIRNYYNMPSNEQQLLLNNLSNITNVSPELINQNIPKLIKFVNTEDTPNYNLIATVKQLGIIQQQLNPEHKILSTPSQMPIPLESEMSLTNMVTQFEKLTQSQQTQLINTISNYSGVSPDFVKKDIKMIADVVKTEQISNAGIYNKIQSLDQLGEHKSNSSYPLNIPKVEKLMSEMETKSESESESESVSHVKDKLEQMKKEQSGIFVDLHCFMNNIEILKNHSDNMMIDLSLLLSNVKSCSYVKKTKNDKNNDYINKSPQEIVDKITSKIEIPTPDIVKLQNMKSTITIPNTNLSTQGQILGIIKEPFVSEMVDKNSDWDSYDFIKILILVLVLALLIFRK